jgi:nucleoside-diphosphate-sugar epimerase
VYHSSNIGDIDEHEFGMVLCAAAPAEKWRANQAPEEDWRSVSDLIAHLQRTSIERFVLISTVDVYPVPRNIDEDSEIDATALDSYGLHRYRLELAVRERFRNVSVVRLPGLYGHGLKKNLIFDLLRAGDSPSVNPGSVFQFYGLDRLWRDLTVVLDQGLEVVNLPTEPVTAADVARFCFGIEEFGDASRPRAEYDMHTKHAGLFGGAGAYVESAQQTLDLIKDFVQSQREARS